MKTQVITKKMPLLMVVLILIASCNQKTVDPNISLDDVFIPAGYVESSEMSANAKTLLDELKMNNPSDEFYYLKFINGPTSQLKDLLFPQKELKIEFADAENTKPGFKYHGVIVKKIREKWTDEIFMEYVDKEATPAGGMKEFQTLVSEKLKYPEAAKENKIEGKVFVQFIVDKDGTAKEVQVVKGIGAGCDAEAERFILNETSWIPAQVANENVKSRMIMPLVFKLN